MEVLDLKDGFILDARYDFIREGTQRGTFALHIRLGDAARYNHINAGELLLQAHRRKWPPRRIVRFTGNVDFECESVIRVLSAFREYGFETHVVVWSDAAPVPTEYVTWSTLFTSASLVQHSFNEIVYAPSKAALESGKIAPFVFPLAPTRGLVALWLNVAADDVSADDVERFLVESPWNWQVAI